jgi:uncharacterized LabA/DUF88 family protein
VKKRTCIFVDGENFRHSIVDLFDKFDRNDYLPKEADWGAFFDDLVKKVLGDDGERIRTYWYVVESLDSYPYTFSQLRKDPETLKSIILKNKPDLRKLDDSDQQDRIEQISQNVGNNLDKIRRRFDGWMEIQNGISIRHAAIEFRRSGAIRYNAFDDSLGPEKGVDVKLATDLIVLKDIYDVAIIVSGDQDYVPAVQVVKDFGKRVVNVAFQTRSGKLLPGGARRLNLVADHGLEVTHDSFSKFLNVGK